MSPRFLLCGLGSIGRRHLRNLLALDQEDIVLYRTGKSTLPDEDLDLPVEHDLETALARWKPDAALVANPTALHLEVAIPAARAGCHLLLEKPVSHSLERLDELQEALRSGGGRALVGYQFRYHPGLRKVRQLVREGAVGQVVYARAHWGEHLPDWHPWEDYRAGYSARADLGGGALLTLSHPFDYLRWILGEVIEVKGMDGRSGALEVDVEDTADALLRFEGGAMGSVHLDYNQRPPRHGLELIGAEGTITWDAGTGEAAWWTSMRRSWERFVPPHGFERNDLFLDEMRHFNDIIAGRAEPFCTLDDGVRALGIALAAREAARHERRVDPHN